MTKRHASAKGMGQQIFKQQVEELHPVESFTEDDGTKIVNIPIQEIVPNPEQPRKYFEESSLNELAESIKSKGLLQPVIVTKKNGHFLLVAGERRYRACKIVGINKIPCIVRSDDPLEIGIIENLQREDLNAIEEAEGLQALADKFKYAHNDLARIVGKSRSTVTEILSLNKLPKPIKDECRTSDMWPKSLLLQVVRQPNKDLMIQAWDSVKKKGLTVRLARELNPKEGERQPGYLHTYKNPEKNYTVMIKFRKSKATKAEIIQALKDTIKDVENE